MTKIFVPQPIPEVAASRLATLGEVTIYPHTDRQIPREELLEAVRDQHVLFAVGEVPYDAALIDAALIDAARELRLTAAMHSSAKFVDFAAATRRKVPVTSVPYNILTKTTAEFTFALLMATAWRLPEADAFLRDGKWHQNQSMALMGTRLHGKTLGIVGMGAIGQMVARRAVACDMHVIYNKRRQLSKAEEFVLGGADFRSLEDLFTEADFVAITIALTKETKGLVGEELISLMKPSAILINTSRGAVLDETALEKALREGRIRGAGLDVYEVEVPEVKPGPSEGLKSSLPNVILTPHYGSAGRETREEMALRTVRNIERFLAGERPFPVFNPEVLGEAPITRRAHRLDRRRTYSVAGHRRHRVLGDLRRLAGFRRPHDGFEYGDAVNDLLVRDRERCSAAGCGRECLQPLLEQVDAFVLDHLHLRTTRGPAFVGHWDEAEGIEAWPQGLGDAVGTENGDAIADCTRQRADAGRCHSILVLHREQSRIVHQRRRLAGIDAVDFVDVAEEIDEPVGDVDAEP